MSEPELIVTVDQQRELAQKMGDLVRCCDEIMEDRAASEEQRQSVQLLRDVARVAHGSLVALLSLRRADGTLGAVVCVHCREVLAADMDSPEVAAHQAVCKKHPMRATEARVRELLDLLREVQQKLIRDPDWAGPMAPSHVLISDHVRREVGQKIEEAIK